MKFQQFYEMAYPNTFNIEEFNAITQYSKKVAYAAKHLQKLGSGSSRVVFRVDEEKVIKIAKNAKGLAQNHVESDWSLQQTGLVAKIFEQQDNDDGVLWLEMEYAKKINPKRFQQLTGVSLKELTDFLFTEYAKDNPRGMNFGRMNDERWQELWNIEWVGDLTNMIKSYDMIYPGDFQKINSYGEVLRNGEPTVVLVDFGLNRSVGYEYYKIN